MVETLLARIEVIEITECWWCGETEQFVKYLYIPNTVDGGKKEESWLEN